MNEFDKRNFEGKIYKSNSYGDFKVLQYDGTLDVLVEFLDTQYRTITGTQRIKQGAVKDNLKPQVLGVGCLGEGHGSTRGSDGKHSQDYVCWYSMLQRCYSTSRIGRCSYDDCHVSENFKNFSYFKTWYHNQVGSNREGFALDKDLLLPDNKLYSEDTCVFLPYQINSALIKSPVKRDLPQGVVYNKKDRCYCASMSEEHVHKYLGRSKTVEGAWLQYKLAKESYLKTLAERFKDEIDIRAYNTLVNYEVVM